MRFYKLKKDVKRIFKRHTDTSKFNPFIMVGLVVMILITLIAFIITDIILFTLAGIFMYSSFALTMLGRSLSKPKGLSYSDIMITGWHQLKRKTLSQRLYDPIKRG